MVYVGRGCDQIEEGPPEGAQGAEHHFSVLNRSDVAGAHQDDRPPVQFLGDVRQRRRGAESHDRAELVGSVAHEVAVEAEDLVSVACVPEDGAGQDAGSDGVELELERGDHTEVAASSAQRPKEVGVLVFGCPQQFAVGGHDIGGEQVVDRETVLAHEPADTTAKGESCDAGVADDAAGGGQPVGLFCWSTSPHRAPPCTWAVPPSGSTRTARIADRSMTIPSSHTAVPATLWPPPRTAISRSCSRAKRTAAATSPVPLHRAMSRGYRSMAPFHRLGRCRIGVVSRDLLALELVDLHGRPLRSVANCVGVVPPTASIAPRWTAAVKSRIWTSNRPECVTLAPCGPTTPKRLPTGFAADHQPRHPCDGL